MTASNSPDPRRRERTVPARLPALFAAALMVGATLLVPSSASADDPEISASFGALPTGWREVGLDQCGKLAEVDINAGWSTHAKSFSACATRGKLGSETEGAGLAFVAVGAAARGFRSLDEFRAYVNSQSGGFRPPQVSATQVQGRGAFQAVVESTQRIPGMVGGQFKTTVVQVQTVSYWVDLGGGSIAFVRLGAQTIDEPFDAWRGEAASVLAGLRLQAAAPTPAALPACNATMLLPGGLKPGDTLSPDARVTSADGKPVQGTISTVWYINGRQANSVTWDGTETRIALQLSCQGRAQEFNAVVPAYVLVNEGGGGPGAPLPPVLVPAGSGAAVGGGLLGQRPAGMGSAGAVPGPRTLGEALVSVLVPAGVGALGAAVSAVGQGVTAVTSAIPMTPVTPAVPAAPGQPGAAEGKKEEGEDREGQREEDRRRTVTPAQLEALQRDFEEMVRQKRADGYWVKNDALLRSLWNSIRDNIPWSDPRGGRCGEFGEWGMEWSKEFVRKTFGDKAIIDDIVMQERSTLNPEGVADTIDSVVGTSNHRATRVILPNGDRYVLDFWEAVSTGKPRLQNEFEWIAHWRWKVSPLGTDAVVSRSDAEQALSRFVREYGEKQGSDMFRRTTSNKGLADTILRSWRKFPW